MRSKTGPLQPPFSPRRAWTIVALIFLVALINYFDRQSLSILAPRMQAELQMSDAGYGYVVSLFLLASAFSYALAGFVADWLGTRTSMAIFVGIWSFAEAATAFVTSTTQLALARFCLGLGEPGLWVAAPKAVVEIHEEKHQSMAVGFYTSGATLGAVIALPVIAIVTLHLPWKSIFIIDGCAGLLWLPFWFWIFPRKRNNAEAVAIESVPPPMLRYSTRAQIKEVLLQSKTWRLLIARGLTDPVWYFYLFWFPKYLLGPRGLSLAQVARIGWMVYLFAGIGTILGGVLPGMLIRRGVSPAIAYRRMMVLYAALVPLSPLAGLVRSAFVCVAIGSIVVLAHMAWLITLSSTIITTHLPRQLGRAFGLIAAGSALGGMFSTEIIANIVPRHGYLPVFFSMTLLHPIALLVIWKTFREKATVDPLMFGNQEAPSNNFLNPGSVPSTSVPANFISHKF